MLLIVPMSGTGQRFLDAGFNEIKPLIKVHDKPIIEHLVTSFPDADRVLFICSNDHLATTDVRSVLKRIRPDATIVGIAPHKLGPVHAVLEAAEHIPDDELALVTFCDYAMRWDFAEFIAMMRHTECDGAVPYYTGFHPHLIHKQLYGTLRIDDDNRVTAFREKNRFTDDVYEDKYSPGAYAFRNGAILKEYLGKVRASGETVNGEYFMPKAYEFMIADGLLIHGFPVESFLQWGTPEDFKEYELWSTAFEEGTAELLALQHPEGERIYAYWRAYREAAGLSTSPIKRA